MLKTSWQQNWELIHIKVQMSLIKEERCQLLTPQPALLHWHFQLLQRETGFFFCHFTFQPIASVVSAFTTFLPLMVQLPILGNRVFFPATDLVQLLTQLQKSCLYFQFPKEIISPTQPHSLSILPSVLCQSGSTAGRM